MTLTASRPETSITPSGWRVSLQLAKVEARRMILHPASLLSLALAIAAMWFMHRGEAPVLNRAGATTAVPLVLIAGGALVASADASVRLWATEQSEALDIAPVSSRVRTGGLLLSGLAPVALGILLQGLTLGVLMVDRPVTALNVWDVLAGGAVIGLAVAFGVAVGRWIPSRFAGPLSLVVLLAVVSFLGSYGMRERFGEVVKWFAPFVALDWEPVEIVFRPAAAHLIYLIGLTGAFACLALLRGTSRNTVATIGLVISVTVAGIGVVGQQADYAVFDPDKVLARHMPPLADYTCETRRTVEYCALAGYEGWIPEWAEVVEAVLDAVPEQAVSNPLTVRQYPTRLLDQGQSFTLDYESGLAVGTWWNRDAGGTRQADAYPFGLALGTASWAVGLPFERIAGTWIDEFDQDGELVNSTFVPGIDGIPEEEISYEPYCSTLNQGRAMVALWLAAQADERTELYLFNRLERTQDPVVEVFVEDDGNSYPMFHGMLESLDNGQYYPWYLFSYWNQEAGYTRELLDRPAAEVESRLNKHWDFLTDPATTTAEAVRIFGITRVPGLEEWMAGYEDIFYTPCP